MWLASVSRRSPITDRFLPTPRWSADQLAEGETLLDQLLAGCGDPGGQRSFRMNLTLCRHRLLTTAEVRRTGGGACAHGIAGGPVAVLWETHPGAASTRPCANPVRRPFPGEPVDPDLWLPIDCGRCPSCRARAAIATGEDARWTA